MMIFVITSGWSGIRVKLTQRVETVVKLEFVNDRSNNFVFYYFLNCSADRESIEIFGAIVSVGK